MKVAEAQPPGNTKSNMMSKWSSHMASPVEIFPSNAVAKIVPEAASDVVKMVTWPVSVPILTREMVVTEEVDPKTITEAVSTAEKMVICPVSAPIQRKRDKEAPWSAINVMRWVTCHVTVQTKSRTVVATSVSVSMRTLPLSAMQMEVTIFSQLVAGATTTTMATTGVTSSKLTLLSKRLRAVGMRTQDTDRAILTDNEAY
jgi:hypothetical protein